MKNELICGRMCGPILKITYWSTNLPPEQHLHYFVAMLGKLKCLLCDLMCWDIRDGLVPRDHSVHSANDRQCYIVMLSLISWAQNCWSLRYSWSIASLRCSNYIFTFNLTHGFNGLGKDNGKMRPTTYISWWNYCKENFFFFINSK